ncbi:histidine phosphatase family protein [Azospirillum sp.]|uniref:histidine phosphatase family protein n=1 Tax=Azospirillum sp. TaxID=34012 RepID=UPI002D586564|nr:histidine phosphatase family protein [Azospirillum sp.]HYD68270.1 histidine phosphatase family protein [Azospirillum sp.]
MLPRRALLAAPLLLALAAPAAGAGADGAENPAGLVILMRHAEAPGFGDPPGLRLGDCATQRNLDDRGRAQARRMGALLRERGIRAARVHSSQWCRCLDTARLLDLGPVAELPALNSTVPNPAERESRTADLRRFLAALPADGPPVVLVTHQVTITSLTGIHPASGEAVLLRATGTPNPPVLGRLKPP